MRIGLISDTHDNRERTRQAIELLEAHEVESLLHAGDLMTGKLAPLLDGHRTWMARGNMDREASIRSAIEEHALDVRYDTVHEIELASTRIGLIHGDDEGRLAGMVNAGAYDLVVHGHTHTFRDERIGSTRVVNPGAVHRASPPSVCVFDTEADALERIELDV